MSDAARRIRLGAVATALVSLSLPALAAASTVEVNGSTMQVVDTENVPRETTVRVVSEENAYEVTEGGPPMTAVAPCVQIDPHTVRCPTTGITRLSVEAGGGNDTIRAVLVPVSTVLSGGQGDDVIRGGAADDLMIGGPGGDQFGPSNPNRTLCRDRGRCDTVSYQGVAEPVTAVVGGGFVSGSAVDGPPGSRDAIDDSIQKVIGGQSFNTLVGDSDFNVLVGGPKHDTLRGEGGTDRLLGRKGRDSIAGLNGSDRLVGGKGRDRMRGGHGIDSLFSKDGFADFYVNCGPPAEPEFVKFDQGLDFPGNC